jgi:hypothetical protein
MPPAAQRRGRVAGCAVAWVLAALCLAFIAMSDRVSRVNAKEVDRAQQAAGSDEKQARIVCGACHALPPPGILPSGAWRDEFVAMMLIRDTGARPAVPPSTYNRTVQLPPDMERVLPYFTSRAPEHLARPQPWPDANESPVRFSRRGLVMADVPNTPAVSNVSLVDLDGDKQLDVLGTDMRHGLLFRGRPADPGTPLTTVASIPHPAHVALTDVDRDGIQDVLVADLGEFFPADHDKGAVFWLRGLPNHTLGAFYLDGWPRVADVESGDFNGDGKNDLAVAAFGWRKTGQVAILENRTINAGEPEFVTHTIDPRAGGIHIIPVDLNHDGKLDFVTLLAQQHETVLAYINKGTGDFSFDQKVIYVAPHPNWGSSGIQLVDLDKDGDLDVLLTHGDSFDDGIVKPYHGIQWLENRGAYPFVEHTLAQMPGVHRALAADVDGDGDLDIVACALLAGGADIDEKGLPALVWLEQTKRAVFVRHTIEMGSPRHGTLDVGDIDGDGDVDIVVGNFSIEKPATAWIDVWTNERQGLKRPAE